MGGTLGAFGSVYAAVTHLEAVEQTSKAVMVWLWLLGAAPGYGVYLGLRWIGERANRD
jgi:hypothetical protein